MNKFENENVDMENRKEIDWMAIGKKVLFPHTFIVFLLFNLTVAGLIYIFVNHLEENILAISFYMVAFYSLVVVCARIPGIVKNVKNGLYANKYSYTYLTDKDLRMRLSMYRGLLINFCFATFKIILGFVYNSSWLFAMAGYNMILSLMRFVVIARAQKKGLTEQEERRRGLHSYEVCGWLVMVLNIAVSVIMFMVIVEKQTIEYHMIVTIGLAAFTFYCFIMAIINMVKYRERKNPVYAAVKRIDMVKAIVSIFTLQVAMLTSFGGQNAATPGVQADFNPNLMNTLTGIAVTIAINTIGAMMIAGARKDCKELNVNGKQ
ncbi:MAG: hypothetical protein IJA07_01670 [Agathobacter sp.]|nr:hypothetical protein [Agathobacter sp.]